MSGFTNETNQGRVRKIGEIISHLQKSADSNQAEQDEIWEVLAPALDAISALCGARTEAPAPAPVTSGMQQPIWATIRQMAQEAPLKDLTMAMAVYINRIDEELSP